MALGICQNAGKAPIIACQVTPERNFAFIEFRWVYKAVRCCPVQTPGFCDC